mgnify:CR=1 FL=1
MKNFAKRISALVLAVVVSAAVLCPAAFAAQLPSLPKDQCVVDDANALNSQVTQTIEELKKLGFWIAGADMNGEDYYKSNLTGPMVIVVGAEGKGLGRLVKEKCDIIVSLPMQGGVSSLNASAAGAVLLYEVVRQRRVQAGV